MPRIKNALKLLAVAALAASLVSTAAHAEAKILPKQSLYQQVTQATSKDEIKALCAEIMKRQNASRVGMLDASSLYLHGKIMGVSCAKVDYYKAYTLARDAKDDFTVKATITYIRGRAAGGNAKAIAALEKIEKEQR